MEKVKNSNIVKAGLVELIDAGYIPFKAVLDGKGGFISPPAGSMLCLVNKSQDLWAELSAADIKASKVTPDKFIILTK